MSVVSVAITTEITNICLSIAKPSAASLRTQHFRPAAVVTGMDDYKLMMMKMRGEERMREARRERRAGALLSIVFLLVLLQLSGARSTLAGSVALTGCAVLLSVVLVEAALLEVVPVAAANGDQATVATAFTLTNGRFTRIYPLAPAPLVFAGIGFALTGSTILPRVFARAAVLISGLFLIAGLAAVFSTAGLILAGVMSGVEAIWIPAAAIAFARTSARTRADQNGRARSGNTG